LAIENAVVETDFKHDFGGTHSDDQGLKNAYSSPYQVLLKADNIISQNDDKYLFLNGKSQGEYESEQLKQIKLPGINNRF
jgi:hypothetical protein